MIDPKELERAILEVLADQDPNLMQPEPALHSEVMTRMGRAIAKVDLAERLEHLRNKNQVIGVNGEDYTRWKIAPNGEARLTSLRPRC